jgi:pimeloyl-ACP methyl ester carboxylesterase
MHDAFPLALLCLVGAACSGGPDPARAAVLETAPSRFATLDGARVHYKSLGRGQEAVVLVHGWTCDLSFWRCQSAALAARGRVIAVDLPGHGRSEQASSPCSIELFARAVDAVLIDAGVDRAVLVGHSMGTPVVRQYYRRYPAKTLALVAVDGSFRPFTDDPATIERLRGTFRGPDPEQAVARMVDGMFAPSAPADLRAEVKAKMLATPHAVRLSAWDAMFDPAIWTEDAIGVPLLAVYAKSSLWSEGYEAFVRRLCPDADYRVMEGTGHFLMLEKPEEFNAILLGFLDRRGLSRG